MTTKSDFLENRVLDRVLKNNAQFTYTFPATVYAALFTADPTEAGTLTSEVSGAGYVRQAITWGTIASGSAANSAIVQFPTASGSWGTVTHVAIVDASTAGNVLYYGALTASKTVGTGDDVSFAIGTLVVTEA